ncbi:type II secretion system F family protein [Paludibacterium paludis]|uniref:Pilus biosynthesis protein n=1 Tax=Paludibacterium paludis TaxID=1225769 RepID=A0A918UAB7_9NEIS|nr:type II secretion system F family protein [Paludibacterium paludis]GGY20797.1 pilus biosynthesis protein [Paludibacterium paludis]
MNKFNYVLAKLAFGKKIRLDFYEMLADFMADGVSMSTVLEKLWEQASDRGKKPGEGLAMVYQDLLDKLRLGLPLSEALKPWIPSEETAMIAAGERSGNMPETLRMLTHISISSSRMTSAIMGAASYPIVLFLMAMMLLWFYGVQVIPAFESSLPPDKWTGLARALWLGGAFAREDMWWMLGGMGATLGIIIYTLPHWTGKVRKALDNAPPWAFYRMKLGCSFLMSLSALMEAGVSIDEALTIIQASGGKWLNERLSAIGREVQLGVEFGQAIMQSGYDFPSRRVVDLLEMYSQTSAQGEALKKIALRWIDDNIVSIQKIGKVLNLLAMLVVTAVIGLMYLGMFALQRQVQQALTGN